MTLLYRTAEWHAFAKLRLHTESTLQHLERLTTELGQVMRKFRDAAQSAFMTFELPKETAARKRRQKPGKGKEKAGAGDTSGKKPKTLNLFTYKWHALGDYVCAIRLFGGTDGFSTQLVSNVFPNYLHDESHLAIGRANLLIKLLNDCMDQPTNATLGSKLPIVIEDLNVPVWRLIGGASPIVLSRKPQIMSMTHTRIRQRVTVTQTCDITSLPLKDVPWTYSAPFARTEGTLLTMYVVPTQTS